MPRHGVAGFELRIGFFPPLLITYCLAHHVTVDGGKRRLMVASLRYLDTFMKMDGTWLFAERRLYVDWLEERVM
jgi:hypothetical protein